jgi:regulator of telomere elongation helicase 1
MPYNYIIEENFRDTFKISFENSILVFDEAHNIASCSEDAASFDLKTKLLETAVVELKDLSKI